MDEPISHKQAKLTPLERLNQIVEQGMCIGCGICDSLSDSIEVVPAQSGFEHPFQVGALDHATIDKIVAVCPGTRVEGLPAHRQQSSQNDDAVWGIWQEIYYAYSANEEIRHLSSTGGLLTALALYLIESQEVNFILHAQASQTNPSFGEACISRNSDDVARAAGSRYGPTATLKNVIAIIDQAERDQEQFAFIGTPCDVSALRNYANFDERVDRYCTYMLTMVCGGFMAPDNMRKFIAARGISFEDIHSLRYRGYGCPGPTTITLEDGVVHEFSYLDFWGDDESHWGLPTRCKVCPDGIGDAADVAAADTWQGGSPTVEESNSDLGKNAAVVRTEAGVDLMNRAIDAGFLVRGEALSPQDMNNFQPHQEAKKRAVWSRFEGMRSAGSIPPETKGLRIRRLAKENTAERNAAEFTGAQSRVESGRFKEPTPLRAAAPSISENNLEQK